MITIASPLPTDNTIMEAFCVVLSQYVDPFHLVVNDGEWNAIEMSLNFRIPSSLFDKGRIFPKFQSCDLLLNY